MNIKKISISCFFLSIVASSAGIQAQDTTQLEVLYKTTLASPVGQPWTLKAWGKKLGTGTGCVQGSDWLFYTDGQLVIRTCVDANVEEKDSLWSISASESGPVEISIDSKTYWIEILIDEIAKPGLPPLKVLVAKFQELRESQEKPALTFKLRRTHE